MTGDFEIAIEEGATMVRLGTALFGERRYAAKHGTAKSFTTDKTGEHG